MVPNYNGSKLLRQYLPSVQTAAQAVNVSNIVVVDDCSTDDSLSILKQFEDSLTVVTRKANGGFGEAVNEGSHRLDTDLMAICMTDMELESDCLLRALELFIDPAIFAVGFHLKVSETSGNAGVTGLDFRRGLLHPTFEIEKNFNSDAILEVAFATGGAMIVRKKYFDELAGFDPMFAPYGWEDIDLAWRAWQRGWKSVCHPGALAWHRHPHSSVESHADNDKRLQIELRNRICFFRKNITDARMLALHRFWMGLMLLKSGLRGSGLLRAAVRDANDRLSGSTRKMSSELRPVDRNWPRVYDAPPAI